MDLLGRKAQAQLEVAMAWIADLQFYIDDLNNKATIREGVTDRLRAENLTLIRKCDELARQLQRLPQRMSAAPLYKSEEEEELEYALRNGDIDMREFKDLLAQAGYENAEVELPERPERPLIY